MVLLFCLFVFFGFCLVYFLCWWRSWLFVVFVFLLFVLI